MVWHGAFCNILAVQSSIMRYEDCLSTFVFQSHEKKASTSFPSPHQDLMMWGRPLCHLVMVFMALWMHVKTNFELILCGKLHVWDKALKRADLGVWPIVKCRPLNRVFKALC